MLNTEKVKIAICHSCPRCDVPIVRVVDHIHEERILVQVELSKWCDDCERKDSIRRIESEMIRYG